LLLRKHFTKQIRRGDTTIATVCVKAKSLHPCAVVMFCRKGF
jgi:hypothetical protein